MPPRPCTATRYLGTQPFAGAFQRTSNQTKQRRKSQWAEDTLDRMKSAILLVACSQGVPATGRVECSKLDTLDE